MCPEIHPDRVLIAERLGEGRSGAGTWGLPGGHLEGGEAFSLCASRQVKKEVGLDLSPAAFRFIFATNDVMPRDAGGHYVTIYQGATLTAAQAAEVGNPEPHKCGGWRWLPWEEVRYVSKFMPLRHFVEEGGIDIARAVLGSE